MATNFMLKLAKSNYPPFIRSPGIPKRIKIRTAILQYCRSDFNMFIALIWLCCS